MLNCVVKKANLDTIIQKASSSQDQTEHIVLRTYPEDLILTLISRSYPGTQIPKVYILGAGTAFNSTEIVYFIIIKSQTKNYSVSVSTCLVCKCVTSCVKCTYLRGVIVCCGGDFTLRL